LRKQERFLVPIEIPLNHLEGAEFSGGVAYWPGAVLFVLALIVTFIYPRIAGGDCARVIAALFAANRHCISGGLCMKKPGKQQLGLALSCLVCVIVALRNTNDLSDCGQ
jgi:hypothetical protein